MNKVFHGLTVLKPCATQISTNVSLTSNKFLGVNISSIRYASKKSGGSTRNPSAKRKPKHRGIHYQDGEFVQKGTMLVTQLGLRYHPGMNVGFGRNGTLFAMETGHVMVTCEKVDLKLDHTWISRIYGDRNLENVYKKYFHVIPLPQHYRFKLEE